MTIEGTPEPVEPKESRCETSTSASAAGGVECGPPGPTPGAASSLAIPRSVRLDSASLKLQLFQKQCLIISNSNLYTGQSLEEATWSPKQLEQCAARRPFGQASVRWCPEQYSHVALDERHWSATCLNRWHL